MHSLSELKDFLEKNNIEIKEYSGWLLKVGKNTFTMSHGNFYLNGNLVERKNILKQLKETKNVKRTSSKTRKKTIMSARISF